MQLRTITYWFLIGTGYISYAQTFEFRTYHDKDQTEIKEIINLKSSDSTLHGPYSSYLQNGAPKAAGFYEDGKASGTWTYYFENNRIKAQGNLLNAKQDGPWSFYFESGHLKALGQMKNGIREGMWTNYYENGDRKSEGLYLNNKKDGKWEYFFEGGDLKAETLFDQGIGHYREFHPNGKIKMEGQNRNDKSEGLWKYFYSSGELESEGNFENGMRVGKWMTYHKNGEIASEGYYKTGKKSGEWIYYYESGNVNSRGTLIDDVKEGQWNLFFEDGEVKSTSRYEHGSGPSTEYYPGGQIMASGTITNGKKTGLWEYFDATGYMNGKAEYENGVGQFTGFYENGTIKMTGTLENSRQVGEWILYDQDGEISGKYKPMYEDSNISNQQESESSVRFSSKKPEYRFKSRSNRFFDEVVNEFRGINLSSNPVWIATGKLPVVLEYYHQERLGYEFQYTYHKNPFILIDGIQQLDDIYVKGHQIQLRQKLYTKDKSIGMPYFGHGIGFSSKDYHIDISHQQFGFQRTTLTSHETIANYSLFLGLKWMRTPSRSGFTVDMFIGLDIGLRNWRREYTPDAVGDFDGYFTDIEKRDLYLPVNFGLNFGWMSSVKRIRKVLRGK